MYWNPDVLVNQVVGLVDHLCMSFLPPSTKRKYRGIKMEKKKNALKLQEDEVKGQFQGHEL